MRILLVGSSGMLGSNLLALNPGHEIYPAYLAHPARHAQALRLDIGEREQVLEAVQRIQPQAILHVGGMTKPAACERDPQATDRVNVQGAAHLVEAANLARARLIFLSTDLVFDHALESRNELSLVRPMSVYGQSKAQAERIIQESSRDYAIVRISVLYGWSAPHTQSFAEWALDEMRKGQRCTFFADQYRNMTYINDLAAALYELAERAEPLNDILHIAGPEQVSRYDLGQEVAKVFGLSSELAQRASMRGLPLAAFTPECVRLDTDKMRRLLRARIRPIAEGVRDMQSLGEQGYRERLAAYF